MSASLHICVLQLLSLFILPEAPPNCVFLWKGAHEYHAWTISRSKLHSQQKSLPGGNQLVSLPATFAFFRFLYYFHQISYNKKAQNWFSYTCKNYTNKIPKSFFIAHPWICIRTLRQNDLGETIFIFLKSFTTSVCIFSFIHRDFS